MTTVGGLKGSVEVLAIEEGEMRKSIIEPYVIPHFAYKLRLRGSRIVKE